jgi:hypothetical protein
MDDYLSKPVRLSDLSRTIKRWIARGQNRLVLEDNAPKSEIDGAPALDPNALARLRSLIPEEAALSELFDGFIDQARESIPN